MEVYFTIQMQQSLPTKRDISEVNKKIDSIFLTF